VLRLHPHQNFSLLSEQSHSTHRGRNHQLAARRWQSSFETCEFLKHTSGCPGCTATICGFISHLTCLLSGGVHAIPQVDYTEKFRVTFDFKNLCKCPVDGFLWAVSERPREAIATIGCSVYEALFSGDAGCEPGDLEEAVRPPFAARYPWNTRYPQNT
jgi:hypothetical protein